MLIKLYLGFTVAHMGSVGWTLEENKTSKLDSSLDCRLTRGYCAGARLYRHTNGARLKQFAGIPVVHDLER